MMCDYSDSVSAKYRIVKVACGLVHSFLMLYIRSGDAVCRSLCRLNMFLVLDLL